MKNTLFALLLLSATFALGQGSVLSGGPVVANPLGQPLPGVTVAVCNSDPGTPTTGGCPGHLATLYTDVTVATACTGTTPIKPLSNPGGAGTGCSNPGTVDGRGNAVAFAHAGQYWCEYYGTGLTGVAVQPCMFPGTSSGVAPITIICSGTDKVSAYNATTGAFTCSAVAGGTPASPDTSVQFNDGGVFGGNAGFTYDKTKAKLSVGANNVGDGAAIVAFADSSTSSGVSGGSFSAYYGKDNPGAGARLEGMAVDALQYYGTAVGAGRPDAAAFYAGTITADNPGSLLNAIGVKIDSQNAGVNNYGIKIEDIGNFTANDHAIETGFGKVTFGAGDHGVDDFVFDVDGSTAFGKQSFQVNSQADVIIGDASTNAHTVRHSHFYTASHWPGFIMSADAGTGAVPNLDLYGNTNHTYLDSGIFTIINNSGVTSTITTRNTGGDFPATGNSEGLYINVAGSGAGTYSGLALELDGEGSDYAHSVALQTDAGSRAVFSGGIDLYTDTNPQPTCAANIRGTFYDAWGAAGVADTIQVCMKDAANAYAWHTVTIP